ncbi:MAG: beta-ketoacyl-ACP synthase II, partial [bacterium]
MARDPIIPRRVVVTGIGVITPIGSTKEAFWESLIEGRGGVQRITRINPDLFPAQIAAEVKDFDPEQFIDRKDLRHMDLFTQFALGAAVQAIEDSGLDFEQENRDRIGVIVGSGIGGMYIFEEEVRVIDSKGPRRITPFFIPMMISDIIAGHISIRYNLRGPNYATTSACATSGHALGLAMREIRYGFADIMIAGGSEAPICETGVGGFCAMKALSTRNDEPEKACRPFDAQRDGFIMGEGAGILVLEEYEHAKKRGARIYAELAGAGFTGDAFHITAPPEDGNGARRA